MRVKEEKKDKLKAIISHIICKTPSVYNVIKNRGCCPYPRFIVKISNDNDSYGSKSYCEVKLGMGNLAKLCEICDHFCQIFKLQYSIDNNILDFHPDDEICIDCYDISEKDFDNIGFLKDNSIGSVGTLAIYALAFTIFHEFGHVRYDDDSMFQIEKERTADNFALEVLNESCSQEQNIRLEDNPKFLGAFLEIILILLVSKPKDAEIAVSHPHPIERLYLFLKYFHIKEESFLWEYAYDTIVEWANENHIAMTFVKDCSLSIKDKFLDFYHRYKK